MTVTEEIRLKLEEAFAPSALSVGGRVGANAGRRSIVSFQSILDIIKQQQQP